MTTTKLIIFSNVFSKNFAVLVSNKNTLKYRYLFPRKEPKLQNICSYSYTWNPVINYPSCPLLIYPLKPSRFRLSSFGSGNRTSLLFLSSCLRLLRILNVSIRHSDDFLNWNWIPLHVSQISSSIIYCYCIILCHCLVQ